MKATAKDSRQAFIRSGTKSVYVAGSGMKGNRVPFTKDAFDYALKKVASAKPSKSAKR